MKDRMVSEKRGVTFVADSVWGVEAMIIIESRAAMDAATFPLQEE